MFTHSFIVYEIFQGNARLPGYNIIFYINNIKYNQEKLFNQSTFSLSQQLQLENFIQF